MPTPTKAAANFRSCYDNDYGDDDDDGFMFGSDDITLEEKDEEIFKPIIRETSSKFWDYPLGAHSIKFVCTCEDLERCIKVVFKVSYFL